MMLAGADRLPASSTAMMVNVFSPPWVAYKMARSPPRAPSPTSQPYRLRGDEGGSVSVALTAAVVTVRTLLGVDSFHV